MSTGIQDMTVSQQWRNRPDDQRYLSLEELYSAVKHRADNSKVLTASHAELKAYGTEQGELIVNTAAGPKFFNHWSFGQMAGIAGAPAGYLRKLPAPLAAACINDGLPKNTQREESSLMVNGNDTLRCATSTAYGRIYDHTVVAAVQNVTAGGNWKIPGASYAATDPKKATTLYASDRDVFLFLVDEQNPVEVNGETLFRGFYAWNSETGSQVFGLATFLYRTVCDNRIIWGQSYKTEIRIRHTSGAPERFLQEGRRALLDYSNQSTAPIAEQIKRAQSIRIGQDEDEVRDFLKKRGFTMATADSVIEAAKVEENAFNTPWALAQGITALARSIQHTDSRVDLERQAGKLLDYTLN